MSTQKAPIVSFLKELMHRRKRLPSQLASDLGISHTTVLRWLSGKDVPNTKSCNRLAEYSGINMQTILSITGHITKITDPSLPNWPEFRQYAIQKYPNELDDDLITMIEDLIERRRQKGNEWQNRKNK